MTFRETLFCLVFAAVFFLLICFEAIEASANIENNDIEKISKCIHELVKISPNHRMNRVNVRRQLAESISLASDRHSVPSYIIVGIIYMESSFHSSVVGFARREIGLMQVHGVAARGCDLTNDVGQIECGTSWLRKCFDQCGTMRGALTAYATGSCSSKKQSVNNRVEYRIRFLKKIHTKFFKLKT